MRRVTVRVVLSALVGMVMAAAAVPATATGDGPRAGRGGWERLPTESFTSPAGDLCPFPLRSDPVFDRVYVRTTSTFPDGSPRRQEYAGPLVVRLTNLDSGESILRDLSGRAVATYAEDGSYDFRISGPAAVGFRAYRGDSEPTGFWVLRGLHVVRFSADGTRTVVLDRGPEENTCTTLA